jgi:hypothetical protein
LTRIVNRVTFLPVIGSGRQSRRGPLRERGSTQPVADCCESAQCSN